ncbi:phosphoribosyltransferase-like protein [Leptospira interrogans]|uniref:phosphoribosyltransferase-like protein n=1 Tax=Leptospira interrogans TaxID=173 RepID=UPI0002BA968C|nr:hypothetical protein [Leptospira interrogans]MCR8649135.1 hypothetical protein [Leptospira interrogans serovar Bataviae]OAM86095.1 hypothetical protein A1343_15790 [Leptospira interrogans serovar Bataviae]QOI40453.1 hypothetical protein Lepto1548_19590 [Leptospira interrogans serovar Bataviae]
MKEYLNQFTEDDRKIVRRFLRQIEFISNSEFEYELTNLIIDNFLDQNGKVALFPVTKIKRDNKDRIGYSSGDKIGYILTNLERLHPNKIKVSPTLTEMRTQKYRSIVYVDDIIGSGTRIIKYAKNKISKTVKSWNSLGYINVHVVAVVGYPTGIKKVLDSSKIFESDRIICSRIASKISKLYKFDFRNIALKYGELTKKPYAYLGFKESKGYHIFEHGCPNNIPSMFWANGLRKVFRPLFKNRGIPLSLRYLFESQFQLQQSIESVFDLNQPKLALRLIEAIENNFLSHVEKEVLVVLSVSSKGVSEVNACNYFSNQRRLKLLINLLKKDFILNSDFTISKYGKQILEKHKEMQAGKNVAIIDPYDEDVFLPDIFEGAPIRI